MKSRKPRVAAVGIALIATLFGLAGCASAKELPGGSKAALTHAEDVQNCFALGDVQKREACIAAMPAADIEACERSKLYACKPYAEMHLREAEVAALRKSVLSAIRKRYAPYEQSERGYLVEAFDSFAQREAGWASYRDVACETRQYLDGMSRNEIPDLSEACRLEQTVQHLAELQQTIERLTEEPRQ